MNTGAKIAIGCGAVVLLAGLGAVVAVVGAGYWVKGKVEGVAAEQKQIEEYKKKADANSWTAPADGVIEEARFVKFLGVRKGVYGIYEAHKAEIDAMKNKKNADFGDIRTGLNLINEVRLAQAKGLADAGMSEGEYTYYVGAVYTTAVASEISKQSGGKSVSQITEETMKQAAKTMKEQADATPDPSLPPEAQKAWQEAHDKMKEQQAELEKEADETVERAKQSDVPAANIALFQKYESDIKKYAMNGLEYLGL
jgi:hypothetical protein